MERRKILLGSGAVFATALAGCTGSSEEESRTRDDREDDETEDEKDAKDEAEDKDDAQDEKDDEKGKKDIPGFDRDDFQIDSDVIQIKDVTYQKQKLDTRVMVTTSDLDELVEEFRALAPGLTGAIRDTEEFFANLEEIKFTLLDTDKNRVFAFFLDLQWLREFLDGDITSDELVDRILEAREQV